MNNEIGGACGTYGAEERCVEVRRSQRKGPLGRPRRRWEDNVTMQWTGLIGFRWGQVAGSSEHLCQ
jgi:hypothetical protein